MTTQKHRCDTGGFDRSICPPPCGAMHSYCSTCGELQDPCPHLSGGRLPAETDGLRTLREYAGPGPYGTDGPDFKAPTWAELRQLADHNFSLYAAERERRAALETVVADAVREAMGIAAYATRNQGETDPDITDSTLREIASRTKTMRRHLRDAITKEA